MFQLLSLPCVPCLTKNRRCLSTARVTSAILSHWDTRQTRTLNWCTVCRNRVMENLKNTSAFNAGSVVQLHYACPMLLVSYCIDHSNALSSWRYLQCLTTSYNDIYILSYAKRQHSKNQWRKADVKHYTRNIIYSSRVSNDTLPYMDYYLQMSATYDRRHRTLLTCR